MRVTRSETGDVPSGNCANVYNENNCGSIIRPVGLPPRRHREKCCDEDEQCGTGTEYAYYSSSNAVLGGGNPFPMQTSTESGTDIVSGSDGTVTVKKGVYLITYSFTGITSERHNAFTVYPYINGNMMNAEGFSVYGTDTGNVLSGSNAFITRIAETGVLFFKAKGTQMLTGSSFNVGIVKLR